MNTYHIYTTHLSPALNEVLRYSTSNMVTQSIKYAMFNFYPRLPPVDIKHTSGIPRNILSTCLKRQGFMQRYWDSSSPPPPPPPPHISPEILPHDVIITSTATIVYTTQ